MKPMKKKRITRRPRKVMRTNVTFSYKAVDALERYMTEYGTIVPRVETGLSQKQQKQLSREIKRARHLAMLPFTQVL